MPQIQTLIEAFVQANAEDRCGAALHKSRSVQCLTSMMSQEATVADSRTSTSRLVRHKKEEQSPERSREDERIQSNVPNPVKCDSHANLGRKRRKHHRASSMIPRTNNMGPSNPNHHMPIPKWIDISTPPPPNCRRRKRRANHAALTDLALRLSNHVDDAIERGLYDPPRQQSQFPTEQELLERIEKSKRRVNIVRKLQTNSEGRAGVRMYGDHARLAVERYMTDKKRNGR